MQQLLLIRHAESQHNARETKDLDSALTKLGRKQAIDVATFLKRKFDDIEEWTGLVSPFLRTLQTAHAIFEHTNLKFKIDWRVHEYGGDLPCLAEVKVPNRKDKFPEFFEGVEANEWKQKAETDEEHFKRVSEFIEWLQPQNDKFIVVSHAMTIYTMIHVLQGFSTTPKWDRRILNTSVTWYEYGKLKYFARYVNSGKDPRPDCREILLF